MKKINFTIVFTCVSIWLMAQYSPIQTKCIGGTESETVYSFSTFGNDFIFAGSSMSSDGDLSSNAGQTDCWFVHFDSLFNIKNSLSFGETMHDAIKDFHIMSDTSFLLLLQSNSNTGDFLGNLGGYDALLRTYFTPDWLSPVFRFGGSGSDVVKHISPKIANGYLICGSSDSNDGDLPHNYGMTDMWVLNISDNLTKIWSKNFGGSLQDEAIKVFQLSDGNIMVFGNTFSSNHMVNGFKGIKDVWVLKLNSMGDTIWTKTYGGGGYDEIVNVKRIGTDKFALIGNSNSLSGDFFYAKHLDEKITHSYSFYHVIDESGSFVFGGSLVLANDNVFFKDMIGSTPQNVKMFGFQDTDPDENVTQYDIIISQFQAGIVQKTDTFGGNNEDGYDFLFAHPLNETDILLLASTYSDDLTSTYHGQRDVLLTILREDTTSSGLTNSLFPQFEIFPNPSSDYIIIKNMDSQWTYFLYDMNGRLMQSENLSENHIINTSALSKGTYIITLQNGKRLLSKKIIKH